MRTRNGGTPKPTPPVKKTPTTRKSAAKNRTPPPALPAVESPVETKRTSTSRGRQPKKTEDSTSTPSADSPETPDTRISSGGKTTKTVARKAAVRKTPSSRGGKRGQKIVETEVPKIEDEELTEQQQDEDVSERVEAEESNDATNLESVETAKSSPEMKIVDDKTEECPNVVESSKKLPEDIVIPTVTESLETAENVERQLEEEKNLDKEMNESPKDVLSPNKDETSDVKVFKSIEMKEVVHECIKEEKDAAETVRESIEAEVVVAENVHEIIKEVEVVDESVHKSIEREEVVAENVHGYTEEEEDVTENVHRYTEDEEDVTENVHESAEEEEVVENVYESIDEDEDVTENVNRNEETFNGNIELAEGEHHDVMDVEDITGEEKSADEVDAQNSSKYEEPDTHMQEVDEEEKVEEEPDSENNIFNKNNEINMAEDFKELEGDYVEDLANGCPDEVMLGRNQEVLDTKNQDMQIGDDVPDHAEETEEYIQLTAVSEERKNKKELEILVCGLDSEAHEDDVKKVFEQIGEVVEIRLHKDASTDKSKAYAFVGFATKEQASRALSELKTPLICGKECETTQCKENDTLFLGNICNTWTKEAVILKLKEYGIESVQNISLVSDPRHEGHNRGFAFLEFPCHAEATIAFKRLQKSDVVLGHAERTAKVAFAEPLREPDPGVLAQVKSVFLDGIPPDWDEEKVREYFESYGEIIRITLSKNISTAKRKDFGFVDYSSHDAAVACIDGITNKELGDMKTKIKVSLSNPMPKPQAVKGEMFGGFRLDGSGRGSGRGGYASNRSNLQRGRGFIPRGRGQFGRTGFAAQHGIGARRPPFHERQMFGRGGGYRAPSHISGVGAAVRPSFEGMTHNATNRDRGQTLDRQPPFPSEGGYPMPYRRPFEDHRFYNDNAHGTKRAHYMTEPNYTEPNRVRPRFDYSAPATVPFQGSHQRDTFGASGSRTSLDYYNNSNYGHGAYRPPFVEYRPPYGGDVRPPYGGDVRPPYGGEVRPPYANARPPYGGRGRPFGGSSYHH